MSELQQVEQYHYSYHVLAFYKWRTVVEGFKYASEYSKWRALMALAPDREEDRPWWAITSQKATGEAQQTVGG
jgi:hypothetical protein